MIAATRKMEQTMVDRKGRMSGALLLGTCRDTSAVIYIGYVKLCLEKFYVFDSAWPRNAFSVPSCTRKL